MANLKTQPTDADVSAFLDTVEDAVERDDSFVLTRMMKEITSEDPVLWGTSIVGFGKYHYVYPTGWSGDFFHLGFSPRKQSLVLYLMGGMKPEFLKDLGKHKRGKGCLYIKRLADVDTGVLRQMLRSSFEALKKQFN